MQKQQADLLQSLRSILYYHHNLGIRKYPLQDGFDVKIKKKRDSKSIERETVKETKLVTEPVGNHEPSHDLQSEESKSSRNTIREISEEVKRCKSCSLHANRTLPVPGEGGNGVVIFIVGGWLTGVEGQRVSANTVFGLEEDAMVTRMLSAIHLQKEDAFITNVIKCGIPSSVQPVAKNINACSSYLHRQIAACSPDIICTMGMIATRIFLDIPRPLSQLRGRFYTVTTANKNKIPLLPTYHPTFLLEHPEMKKATWVDLQLIEKELKKKVKK